MKEFTFYEKILQKNTFLFFFALLYNRETIGLIKLFIAKDKKEESDRL